MSKWTPGPWETLAEDGFTVIGYVPTDPDGEPSMVVISDASASMPDEMARANARLIAAAPEMAELLALVVDGAEAMGWDVGPKIRALLAKETK